MMLPRKSTMTLVVVGSLGSGKTDLFKKLFCRRPASVSNILIGTIKFHDTSTPGTQQISYKVLVLPANDSFKGTRARHYIQSDAIVVVYNKTKYRTFEEITKWIEEILSIRRNISIALVEYTPKEKIVTPHPSKLVTALDTQELLQKISKKYKITPSLFTVSGVSKESMKDFLEQITKFLVEAHAKRVPPELIAEKEVRKEAIRL